ncbi:MAG: class II aldolase/adducin family protein [Blastococcus sp.]
MTASAMAPRSLSPAEQRLGGLVALAARILSDAGHDDFNQGQVSARLPGSDRLLIKNALIGFEDCTPDTVVAAPLDPSAPPPATAPPELVLHQAVYAARPDVQAIVHSHAPHTLVFGATDLELRPLSHDGAFFADRLPRFVSSSRTILDLPEATAVAGALGDTPGVLLRNHGGVTVGRSVRHATVFACLLERACRLQLLAESTGHPYHWSSASDVEAKRRFNFADLSVRSYWDHSAARVRRAHPAAASWGEVRR